MPSRKRSLEATDLLYAEDSTLHRLRNMWQFANLCQWIYMFGKTAKIDESIDIEDIEAECLNPDSSLLADIALALLKLVSSHRGLTQDVLDNQARKQYLIHDPSQNPFGDAEIPLRFQSFDVFTKVRILQKFTQWSMIHPERIREKMEEQRDSEQTTWRIEPYGWDSGDRVYYVLDDNRVYRLTEAPSPLPARSQKKSSQRRRSNKRRRVELTKEDEYLEPQGASELEDDGLGGMTWECLAVTLDDLKLLLESFRKSKDENEKILRRQLQDHLLPILEKQEESRKRKAQQRERELLNLAKMANAKRSSRIANKVEQQKQDEKEKEELILHRKTEEARRQQEQKQHKIEQERDSRLASRENRLKEREARRHRHEEDLAQLSEDSKHVDDGSSRISERRIHAEIEKNRQALKELDEEDEDWVFDCICGLYGQVDDGEHSVACEKCNVWQHSKCLGIHETEAERVDFHFICQSCSRHNADADERPRTTIKLKINRTRTESLQPIAGKFEYEGTNNDTPVVVPKPSEPSVTISTQEETSEPVATESEPNTNGYRHGSGATQSIHTLADESDPLRKDVGSSTAPTPSSTLPATSLLGEKLGILGSANPPNNVAPEVDSLHQSVTGHQDFVPDSSGENVNIPSGGGLSPTKHSPSGTLNEGAPNSAAKAFHSGVTLSPNPTATILTPPTKPTEPSRPAWHR